MLGRARQGAACAASLRTFPTAPAGLLGVSLGVLGWLAAQAATFGVADHTHLTAHGVTTHRHDYAAPLAAGAGGMALLAVLLLLLVHLSSSHPSNDRPRPRTPAASPSSPARLVGRFSPVLAALLFVAVEAVEFIGSGTPITAAAAVLAAGAGLQVLLASAASAVTDALVHGIEHVSTLPTATAAVPHRSARRRVAAAARSKENAPVLAWGCRAPPAGRPAFAPTV
jgi:hypothetical protein